MNETTIAPDTRPANLHDNVKGELDALAQQGRMAISVYVANDKTEQFSRQAKQQAVIAYGRALLAGRKLHLSDEDFGQWVQKNGLDGGPYASRHVRRDAIKAAEACAVSDTAHAFAHCPAANPTGMRVWAYKTGLIKPKPKPAKPTVIVMPDPAYRAPSIQELKRRAAIAAGQAVPQLPLDQETKDKIDEDVKERADKTGLVGAERGRFERTIRAALRKVVQEGRSYKEKCDVEQRKLVDLEVERRLELALPNRQKRLDEADRIQAYYQDLINRHKPIFTAEEYNVILKAVHEDNVATPGQRKEATQLFIARKLQLTKAR